MKKRPCVKKNLNASRPSEHPPVKGENVKTFGWDQRLQIQNLPMAFERVPLKYGSNIGMSRLTVVIFLWRAVEFACFIAHGSVEFCEATPIGLADDSKESLYGREIDRDLLRSA